MKTRPKEPKDFVLDETWIGSAYLNGFQAKLIIDYFRMLYNWKDSVYVNMQGFLISAIDPMLRLIPWIAPSPSDDALLSNARQILLDLMALYMCPTGFIVTRGLSYMGDQFLNTCFWERLSEEDRQSSFWKEFFAALHVLKFELARAQAKEPIHIGKSPQEVMHFRQQMYLQQSSQFAAIRDTVHLDKTLKQQEKQKQERKILLFNIKYHLRQCGISELQALLTAVQSLDNGVDFEREIMKAKIGMKFIIDASVKSKFETKLTTTEIRSLEIPVQRELDLKNLDLKTANGLAATNLAVQAQGGQIAATNLTVQAQGGQIAATNLAVQAQGGQIAATNLTVQAQGGQIAATNLTVQAQGGQIAATNLTVQAQGGQIAATNLTVQAQGGQIAATNLTVQAQGGQIAATNLAVQAQAGQIAVTNLTVQAQGVQIAAMDRTVQKQGVLIIALDDDVKTQKQKITELDKQIQRAKQDVERVEKKLEELMNSVKPQKEIVIPLPNESQKVVPIQLEKKLIVYKEKPASSYLNALGTFSKKPHGTLGDYSKIAEEVKNQGGDIKQQLTAQSHNQPNLKGSSFKQ